jgi:hypothetical protein
MTTSGRRALYGEHVQCATPRVFEHLERLDLRA